jgi:plasmid stability protein
MVEENEIRVGLSYYERARIAARAAEQGVYPDETAALRGLFASASRAKRSKIGSFMVLYHALDADLRFASAIPERLGLALVRMLKDDPRAVLRIKKALSNHRSVTPEDEAGILTQALTSTAKKEPKTPVTESDSAASETIGGVRLDIRKGGTQLTLSGPDLSEAFLDSLRAWLRSRN